MRQPGDHIIYKVRWDADFSSRKDAFLLQNRISDWSATRMQHIIARVFDGASDMESVIDIQNIEVDLGFIYYNNLEEELERSLEKRLKESLFSLTEHDIISSGSTQTRVISKGVSSIEIFGHFLINGYMPWNYSENMESLVGIVTTAIEEDPGSFIEMLQSVAGKDMNARKRLVFQLPDEVLEHIVKEVEPTRAKDIFSFRTNINAIQRNERIIPVTGTDLNKEIWLWVVNYLFADNGSVFNKRAFMRSMIRQMAISHNISYANLLFLLDLAVRRAHMGSKISADFLEILREVEKEDFLPRLPLSPEQKNNEWRLKSILDGMSYNYVGTLYRLIADASFRSALLSISEGDLKKISLKDFLFLASASTRGDVRKFLQQLEISWRHNGYEQSQVIARLAHWLHQKIAIKEAVNIEANKLGDIIYSQDTGPNSHYQSVGSEESWTMLIRFLERSDDGRSGTLYSELVCSLSELNKERFRKIFVSEYERASRASVFFDKLSGAAFNNLCGSLMGRMPELSSADIGQLERVLRDVGLNMPAEAMRKACIDYYINDSRNILDRTALMEELLSAIARYNGVTIADVAEMFTELEYGNFSLSIVPWIFSASSAIYKKTLVSEKEGAIAGRVKKLLHKHDAGHKAYDHCQLQASLSMIAMATPVYFSAAISHFDAHELEMVTGILGVAIIEQLLNVHNESTRQFLSTINNIIDITETADDQVTTDVKERLLNLVFNATLKKRDGKKNVLSPDISLAVDMRKVTHASSALLSIEREIIDRLKKEDSIRLPITQYEVLCKLAENWAPQISLITGLNIEVVREKISTLLIKDKKSIAGLPYSFNKIVSDFMLKLSFDMKITGLAARQLLDGVMNMRFIPDGQQSAKVQPSQAGAVDADVFWLLQQTNNDISDLREQPELMRDMIEQAPEKFAALICETSNDSLIQNILRDCMTFTAFCEAIAGRHRKSNDLRKLGQHYLFSKALCRGTLPSKLENEYWGILKGLLNGGMLEPIVIKRLNELLSYEFAGLRKSSAAYGGFNVARDFGCLSASLKDALPAHLFDGEDTHTVMQSDIVPDNKDEAVHSGVATHLLYFIIGNKYCPDGYRNCEVPSALKSIIDTYPYSLYFVLKYHSVSEADKEWLHRNIGIETLLDAISALDVSRRMQLGLLLQMYRSLSHVNIRGVRSTRLQYLLFRLLLNAWTSNNWRIASAEQIWYQLVRDARYALGLQDIRLIEHIDKIEAMLPSLYKSSFKRIKRSFVSSAEKKAIDWKQQFKSETHFSVVVNNAGIVLLNGYLPLLLERLGVTSEKKFINEQMRELAVQCIHFIATGQGGVEEYHLSLYKVLCGMNISDTVDRNFEPSEEQRDLMQGLIYSLMDHWPHSGCTTVDGFRGTWFLRKGVLKKHEKKWELIIDKEHRKPYDLLLDKSPFSFSVINHPWMQMPLYVSWNTGN